MHMFFSLPALYTLTQMIIEKPEPRPHLRHGVQASAVVITLHSTINVIIFEYSKVVNFYKLNILMCYNFAKLRLCQSSDLKTSPLEIANY